MPIANIKTIKGALTAKQKQELHQRFADLMVEIEGRGNEKFHRHVILTIDEDDPANFSIGGRVASSGFISSVT